MLDGRAKKARTIDPILDIDEAPPACLFLVSFQVGMNSNSLVAVSNPSSVLVVCAVIRGEFFGEVEQLGNRMQQ
jgi:hypothetical protein